MKIQEIMKRIKFESEFTQEQIANILGCTQVSISRIKRGNQFPSSALLLKIIKLAKQYNIEVDIEEILMK